MKYIECPSRLDYKEGALSLFLAGGITGCPDWQKEAVDRLSDLPVTVMNPRRKNFSVHDKDVIFEQISWEFDMMTKADIVVFYFPSESICPIALYELGRFNVLSLTSGQKVFIGVHPNYTRKDDVIIQTRLANGGVVCRDFVHLIETLRLNIQNTIRLRKEVAVDENDKVGRHSSILR